MLSCERCNARWHEALVAIQTAVRHAGNYVWERTACCNAMVPARLTRLLPPLEPIKYYCCYCCRRHRRYCGSSCCCCSRDANGSGKSTIVAVQPATTDVASIEKLANNNFIIDRNNDEYNRNNIDTLDYAMEVCDGNCSLCVDNEGYTGSVGGAGGGGGGSALLLPVAETTTPVLSVGIPVEIKPTHATDNHSSSNVSTAQLTAVAAATAGVADAAGADTMSTISAHSALSAATKHSDRVSDIMGEELQAGSATALDVEATSVGATEEPIIAQQLSHESAKTPPPSKSVSVDADASPVVATTRPTSVLSRSQSTKSLTAQEPAAAGDVQDAVSHDSFVVVEDVLDESTSSKGSLSSASPLKMLSISAPVTADPSATLADGADGDVGDGRCSPTIAELKSLSRHNSIIAKSMESLYERRAQSKPDSLDNTTTESCSSACSQLPLSAMTLPASLPLKPQHTPLKQKAKTTHFLKRDRRRISPVKQSIRMVQAELYPATLTRFERPREALLKTFDQLDSPNWEVIITGLKSMVRLMRYHPEHLENQMHMVCIQLTRSVRNLRSQVARAACQAASELFTLKSKYMEQECDDLIGSLLHRTADTNRFLRADATHALESMCDNLPPPKVLNLMATKGALHQNALVRTTAAKMLNRLVERLGSDRVFAMARENRDKFFVTGANLLLEGSLETRSYAKSLFRMLSDHQQYNRMLLEIIPPRTYRNIEKTLKNIR